MRLKVDNCKVNFGADADVELLHVPDTGLRLNGGMGLSFRDGAININSDSDGDLDIGADSSIDFNINGSEVGAWNSSGLTVGGGITAASLGAVAVTLSADMMVIDDGAGGTIKTTSLANYATALAAGSNEGLSSTAGRLGLDLNDLAAAAVDVAADSIAIVDANDSSKSKKEMADLV